MNTARLLVPIFTLQDFLYLLLDFLLAGFHFCSIKSESRSCEYMTRIVTYFDHIHKKQISGRSMMGIAVEGSERGIPLFRCKAPQHTIVRTMRMPALGRARLRSPNRVNDSFGIDFECPATVTMTIHRMRIKKEQVQPDLLGSYLLYRCIDHHYIPPCSGI